MQTSASVWHRSCVCQARVAGCQVSIPAVLAELVLRLRERGVSATARLPAPFGRAVAREEGAESLRSFVAGCLVRLAAACALCLRRRPALYRWVCAI